jgi:N-acetylglutamate synthase/N-acetylornithine aminotransferase
MKITFSPFDKKEIAITVGLPLGKASATVYTCDFSCEYVRINAEYN